MTTTNLSFEQLTQAVGLINVNDKSLTDSLFTNYFNVIDDNRDNWMSCDVSEEDINNIESLLVTLYNSFKTRGKITIHDDEYDYGKFKVNMKTWEDLYYNETGITVEPEHYTSALIDYILKYWYPLPYAEVQHPVLAAQIMCNPIAIPPQDEDLMLSLAVPMTCFVGASGTNKSKTCEFCINHFPMAQQAMIKPQSTGYTMVKTINEIVTIEGSGRNARLRPGGVMFDNVYWEDWLKRIELYITVLLAISRNDSITSIGQDGKKGFGDMNCYGVNKYISTVFNLVDKQREYNELRRRMFFFYTKLLEKKDLPRDPGDCTWGSLKKYYKYFWQKSKVETEWFKVLRDVLEHGKLGTLTEHQSAISKVNLATGVYTGVYDSIGQGIDYLEAYWKYVSENSIGGDLLFQLLTNYLNSSYYPLIHNYKLAKRSNKFCYMNAKIDVVELFKYLSINSQGLYKFTNNRHFEAVEKQLERHNLIIATTERGTYFVDRSIFALVTDDTKNTNGKVVSM